MMKPKGDGSGISRVEWLSHWVAALIWLPCLGAWKLVTWIFRFLMAKRLRRFLTLGFLGAGLVVTVQVTPTLYGWMALRSEAQGIGETSHGRSVDELKTRLEEAAVRHGFSRDPESLDPFVLEFDSLEEGQVRCLIEIRMVKVVRILGICPWRLALNTRLSCLVVPAEYKRKSIWERMGLE